MRVKKNLPTYSLWAGSTYLLRICSFFFCVLDDFFFPLGVGIKNMHDISSGFLFFFLGSLCYCISLLAWAS